MQIGDKVRVKSFVNGYARLTGVIIEPSVIEGMWVVQFNSVHDAPSVYTRSFGESELEPLAQNDGNDLVGKRVRVLRGYWKMRYGQVVGHVSGDEWGVLLEGEPAPLAFPSDKLEVVDSVEGQPIDTPKGVLQGTLFDYQVYAVPTEEQKKPKTKPRKFTPDELLKAAQGDSLPTQWIDECLNVWIGLMANVKEEVK